MTKHKSLVWLMMLIALASIVFGGIIRRIKYSPAQKTCLAQSLHSLEREWVTGCGCCAGCTCKHIQYKRYKSDIQYMREKILHKFREEKDFRIQDENEIEYEYVDHRGMCWCIADCSCACAHGARDSGGRDKFPRARCGCDMFAREAAEEEKRRVEATRPKGKTERCNSCNATGLDDGEL